MKSFIRKSGVFAIAVLIANLFFGSTVFGQSQTFNSSATNGQAANTFKVPDGITSVTVECWGGGGKGSTMSSNGAGGGGGGGAYSKSVLSVSPGSTYTVNVGNGSTSAVAPGGNSWFNTASTILAVGGNSVQDNTNASGAGGAASSGIGTTKFSGGNGAIGTTNSFGGGGGSSAGTGADGNYTNVPTVTNSSTGGSITGGGSGGNGRTGGQGNGNAGAGFGGGGGGALRTSFTTRTGGNGADGQVVVSWICSNTLTSGAGTNLQTLCVSTNPITNITYQVAGATGATVSGLPANVTATYNAGLVTISGTPTAAGVFNYTVTPTGGCTGTTATGSITVIGKPTAVAGTAINTCSNVGSVNVTAGSSAANSAGVTWSTPNGTGTFTNANSLTLATYTPSAADIAAGSITLTLTATPNSPCVGNATSSKTLTINAAPTAVAGTAVTTCSNAGAVNITGGASVTNQASVTWTSNGTGTFANANSLTLATYAPSAADITAGSRTLTLTAVGNAGCANATSTKNITITTAPTVSLASSSICIGSTTTVSPTTGGTWVSNNPSIASVTNAGVVTAGSTAGTATFTFTSSTTGCSSTTSALTVDASCQVITLTQPDPLTVTISGSDATICNGQSAPITVTITGGTAPYIINGVQQTGTGPFTINESPTSTTTYDNSNITVTDANSCASTISGNVTINVNPDASIGAVTGTSPLCIGISTTYTASDVVLGGGTGAWSSDNTNVATVDPQTGEVTAIADGTANIIFTITGGCNGTPSAQETLTVLPNASVGAVTGTSPLCINASATFTASDVVLGGGTGTWSSDNTNVATVDPQNGSVTAHNAGTANIIFTINGGCHGTPAAQQSLTVLPNASVGAVSGISPLCVGATNTYTVSNVVLGGGTGTWSSDNTNVATVNAVSGKVTTHNAGTANIAFTITSGCNGTPSAQKTLTVLPDATIGTVTGTSPLCINASATFTASGVVLGGGTGTWSSDNTNVATVDPQTGSVTAHNAGTANIIFTINGGCNGTPAAQQSLNVLPNASVGAVSGTSPLCVGATNTYAVSNVILSGGTGSWSSDNTNVATVNAVSGKVTTHNAGTANIIFTINGGCNGTPSAQKTLTVLPDASVGTVTGTSPLCVGVTNTYTVSNVILGGGTGVWSSDNTSVATVDPQSGAVTAVADGTANIIFSITGGCNGSPSAQQSITVLKNAGVGTVTGTSPLCIGVTTTYTAGNVILGGGIGTWSSDNTNVATVDPQSGDVTAHSAGTVNIIFTINGGCNGTPSAQQSLTVYPDAAISSVTVASTPLCIGDVTLATANGVILGGTGVGAWSSSDPTVVTVDASGNITAVGAGTANVIYTVTGGCNGTVSAEQSVTVNANSTISLSSGSAAQTVCINNDIEAITYAIGGGATGAHVAGLPAGVTGTYSNGVFTISGSPTVSETFTYVVTTEGPCINPSLTGTITVNANSTLDLTSAATTTAQIVCIDHAIANITYAVDDGGTGAGVTGLPNGVTGSFASGVFTISGTPTESGIFNYTVTTTGPCVNPSLSGTITVNANSTISLSSATGTDGQTVCISHALTDITYAVAGGATGASITAGALPAGVTASYNSGIFTISGTPTESGNFAYTITTEGPCVNVTISGTLLVNANSTMTLSSASGTDEQIVCINNAISPITYQTGDGATGASITAGALPGGVTGNFSGGVFTIHGTPTEPGTFNYTVTTAGPCENVSLNGTIEVNDNSTIALSSAAATNNQTVCINTPVAEITYATGGGATGASITAGNLPAGVTGSFANGAFTISGTPTEAGVFPYTITAAGPCINPSVSGTITVNATPVVNTIVNAVFCNNASAPAINFTSPTTGGTISYTWTSSVNIGFGTSGTTSIAAYTAMNNTNAIVTATITVVPHLTNNTVKCDGSPITFTITVNPSPVINPISNLTFCSNTPGNIAFTSPITGGTVTYSWTSSINVGFGLNGTGSIGSFTASNNSFSPLTASVTVTPSLNGCAGTPVNFTVTVNPVANAGTISGAATLCPGITSQLSTTGITGGTWSSNTPSIASVDPVTGLVTAHSTGSANIVYTVTSSCGASSASFPVTVNNSANAGTISGPATVCAGSSIVLTTNGASGGTWLSGSPSATVNALGVVTGVSQGTATIFYFINNTCGSSFTSYNISVSPGVNAGTISGPTSVCAGAVTQLFTTGTGGVWSSSNNSIAIVDANGFVLGLNAGTTTINYTVAANGCSTGAVAHYSFTVNPSGNAGTISGPTNVCVNAAILLTTTGSTGGTWVSGSASATVNAFGLVTGVSAGSATIYYFVSNTCGSSFATYNVNVSPAANAGTIAGPSSVCKNSTVSLSTSGNPGGTWSTNNPSVAIVDANGVVLGTGTGTATITYTVVSACATASATATVTVNPVPNAGTVTGTATLCAGLSSTFSSNGSTGGTWSSSNPSVASVNATSGVVTGAAGGSAIITYSVTTVCGTQSASSNITINPVLNAGVISGGSTVCNGSTLNLVSDGSTGGSWTSSNTAVATIDGSSGIVSTVSPGTTTITYTISNGCGTFAATKLITVNAVASVGSISGASTVCTGASTTLTVTGTSGGTWSSSNPAAASVNSATGMVTGVAAGTTTITYSVVTSCGNATVSKDITVNALADAGAISGPTAVCESASIFLTSNIPGGLWATNSPGVATVNSSGKVTGVTAGNVTITYTVTGTCGGNTATYNIAVNPVPNAGTLDGQPTVCVGASIFLVNTGGSLGGTWRSSNPARASVDPVTGQITGISAGSTIITYSVTNSCGSSTAGMLIIVNSLPDAGTISGQSAVCAGSTINLSSSGNSGGTWTSTATNIATVDPSTGVVTGVAQGSATIVYTVGSAEVCGLSSATHLVTVNPLAISGTITGASSICTGLSANFTSNGSTGGTWSSSNPAVASVNATTGVVVGVAAGSATISYSVTTVCGTSTASSPITVNAVPNAGTISGATSVCIGSNIILSSNISGGVWSSGTTAVATVDASTGKVTGVAAGNSTITYTVTTGCGSASATYAITVNPIPNAGAVFGITFVCTGSTTTLASDGLPGGTWSSSNTAAATVNPSTGVVIGVTAGTTTITYTVSTSCGTVTSSAVVTVGDLPHAGTVTGVAALCSGSTAIFASNGTGGGTWSSNNNAAATVNSVTGEVTGVAPGSATISYTVSSTCGSSVSSANITISALPNAGLITGSATVCAGSVTTFSSNGAAGGTWSSNNNLVAGVNATTGVVTAVAAGTATITYTVGNTCGTATATARSTVNALPVSGTVSGAASVCVNATTGFTSTGNGGGTWSSSNTAAATVNGVTGVVKGIAAGSATISYTVNGSCGTSVSSANITVNPLPDAGIVSGTSVCVGATTTYSSTGDTGGTWISDNTSIATVDAASGVVNGVSAGSTIISYKVVNGCGTAIATHVITVNPLANAGTISGSATVCVGATTTYHSSGLAGGTWSSQTTAVATVDPATGLITGVTPGTATITYTVTTPCGTATATSNITVIILPNAGTISGAATVCAGSNTTYSTDGLTGGTWSSVTPSVATVDPASGVVTGVAAGNATITYTFTNGCGTASATKMITVNPLANAGTISGSPTVCLGANATFTTNGLSGGVWSIDNSSVASISSTGVVTGLSAGNAIITYTSTTPCGTASATANVAVVVLPDAGTVSGASTVCVGATTPYTSNGLSGGSWSSLTPSVATVDPSTGVVTGVSAGNATITYTFTNGCGTANASKLITVNSLANAGTVSGAANVCVGSVATFTSNGLAGGTWSSSDPTVATVSASGVVTGVAGGTAVITYTSVTPCGTASATANISVTPVLSAGNVSGSATVCIGSNTTYASDGSSGGTWSSVTPSVATVNAATGVVTGVSTGNATIVYTVTNSCGTASSSKMIAVSLAGNPGTLTGSSTVCSGSTITLSRTGGTNGGTWSSSNTAVATVSNSGQVTGVSGGTAVISYSVVSGCGSTSATKSITVNQSPTLTVSNITVPTDLNVCSASVTLGSNVTVTGSPTSLEYRIGIFPFFSIPISSTHTFYRGTTPVIVIASNSCNSVARIFLVTVEDNQPPVITCKPNAIKTTPNTKYSVHGKEFDATATDGCGVASLIYSLSGATVEGFERENTSVNNVKLNVGVTTITWKATDVNGNVSTCSTQVTVNRTNSKESNAEQAIPGVNQKLEMLKSEPLSATVAPNPTSNYFTISFRSGSPEKIKIEVVDISGRSIEKLTDIIPNSSIQLGGKYYHGVYLMRAVQGKDAIVLKLIKEN